MVTGFCRNLSLTNLLRLGMRPDTFKASCPRTDSSAPLGSEKPHGDVLLLHSSFLKRLRSFHHLEVSVFTTLLSHLSKKSTNKNVSDAASRSEPDFTF